MVFVQVALIACGTTATFNSLDINLEGKHQILRGSLTKPTGDGPFPAIVLLHGCAGILNRDITWMNTLQRWGYVSLLVDSFGTRGKFNICGSGQGISVHPNRRARDAHGAKLYLESLPLLIEIESPL